MRAHPLYGKELPQADRKGEAGQAERHDEPRKGVPMTEKKVKDSGNKRKPDCVTELHFGRNTLVVSGYFKEQGTKTAEDIMLDVLKAECEAGLIEDGE